MKCYLCGSENHFKRDGKVRDDHGINILQCKDCGLVFLDKQNTGDRFYENNSMLSKDFFKLTGRNTEDENLQMQIDTLEKDRMGAIQWRCEFAKPKIIGKDILDFGSGRAEFLILAQPWAKSVAGLEIEAQVKSIYKEHNINLFENIQDITGGGMTSLPPSML